MSPDRDEVQPVYPLRASTAPQPPKTVPPLLSVCHCANFWLLVAHP
jgi:hypothetical protein